MLYLHFRVFYRLKEMIRCKAGMAGIRVEIVNPEYTSQTCECGHRDKANRSSIRFKCRQCGYTIRAVLSGAIHIAKAGTLVIPRALPLVADVPPVRVHANRVGRADDTALD
ncbi:transposase [Polycladomyces sp. WAk]|uniref:Transposase n=1 Tax=Polycladomyces zharkentensis TaxID=2807616 RepID=A0ABS2WKV8_9BACL|nr:transposase [Polycladomyces sp. WAk]